MSYKKYLNIDLLKTIGAPKLVIHNYKHINNKINIKLLSLEKKISKEKLFKENNFK